MLIRGLDAKRANYVQQGLRALFALFCLLLLSCNRAPALHTFSGPTMGTTWSVKIVGLPQGASLPEVRQDLQTILESLNRQMSTYQPDSEISQFNKADAQSWQELSADFFTVLDYALRLAKETGGAYDPTVGPLVNLWGFGPDKSSLQRPEASAVSQALSRTGWQGIVLDPLRRVAQQPGNRYLDLSSIAKGYAVDKLAEYFIARGLESYLVEIGGELRAGGRKPDGSLWRIAIERPEVGVRQVERVLELDNLAMATSGDYRNFFEAEGQTYSHIIDPRSGYPVDHLTASVTVLAETCAEADALATALTVLGPEAGLDFAEQRQLAVLFIVRTDQGFAERASQAFKALPAVQQEK